MTLAGEISKSAKSYISINPWTRASVSMGWWEEGRERHGGEEVEVMNVASSFEKFWGRGDGGACRTGRVPLRGSEKVCLMK